jgi:prepilin-type N-terminal cleavage/methylation domain-containing protein
VLRIGKAFTLIEVIVVILILAIVASLIFPTFGRSRESGRQAVCISNLRQIQVAINIYASDSDVSELGMLRADPYTLGPYVSSREIFYCPDWPSSLRSEVSSSYQWRFLRPPVPNPANPENDELFQRQYDESLKEYQRLGDEYPLLICHVHDELYYQPSEVGDSKLTTGAFVIELRNGGSVFRGRMPYERSRFLKLLLSHPQM